jgi:hypothetical protein
MLALAAECNVNGQERDGKRETTAREGGGKAAISVGEQLMRRAFWRMKPA